MCFLFCFSFYFLLSYYKMYFKFDFTLIIRPSCTALTCYSYIVYHTTGKYINSPCISFSVPYLLSSARLCSYCLRQDSQISSTSSLCLRWPSRNFFSLSRASVQNKPKACNKLTMVYLA